ncbi:hypothetical protein [Sinomonas albida]|uniref:hypothetical protein n=1 Tax=Sinomonas albida TaxID=369942 RepID=UPI003015A0F5
MRALFRLSRAATVAGATVLLAAAAHTAAGGRLPDPLIFLAVLALTFLPAAWLCGKRLTPATVLGLLGSGQLVLHSAFATLSEASATVPQFSPTAGHVHILGTPASSEMAAAGAHMHGDGPAMLAAHILATLAVGLLLAKGEDALWALLAWLRPLVRLLLLPALHPFPTVASYTPQAFPRLQPSLRLPSRRGPPVLAAVA